MALSPTSSRGGGLPLTGGTLTGPLVISPGGTDPALTLNGSPGAAAAARKVLILNDDTATEFGSWDAAGEVSTSIDADNGSTFQVGVRNNPAGTGTTLFRATTGSGIRGRAQNAGALATVAPVSGAAFQCSTAMDVLLVVPVTYNPGVATTATCKVELSPDNVTFSELVTITQPVGTVFDGSIEPVTLVVPAAWRVKLTVVNATLGTGTYY